METFIPAVSVYAGVNINFDSPFTYVLEPKISPKVMLISQNQFPGSNVFVLNVFMDKISSLNPVIGYVMTYTKGFNDHWSAFIENKGVKSEYYSDGIFTVGAAYLFKKNMQIDASISKNYKDTPAVEYGGIGLSWRFEKNYKEVRIKNIDKNKTKKDSKKDDKKSKKRKDEVPTPTNP
jgi:Putative MetA-pathway of phenol degradation